MTTYWNNFQDRQKMKQILNRDEILLSSTDTVLGLLGRLTKVSYENLNRIKQRSDKPYLIMIRSVEMLPKFIDQPISPKVAKLLELSWPGPVTLIFKARSDLPDFMKNVDGTIALRVPHHEGLLDLLQDYDGLFSTSANMHTKSIPESVRDVDPLIKQAVAGVCVDSLDRLYPLSPSTILDCSSESIKVVRFGSDLDDRVKELII